jgi:peptidoglycan/xylan/chitin deacetylase (PgdA/CDA1 family)
MGRWTSKTGSSRKRNSGKDKGPMHAIKRGLASLFVCLIVVLPIFFTVIQWGNVFGVNLSPLGLGHKDSRKVTALQVMQTRTLDKRDATVKPFEQPIVSVTFDDGWESVYTQAAPLLQKYGIPTTQYVLSGTDKQPSYMTFDQIKSLHQAGHEIGCHTIDHPDLTTLSRNDLMNQLTGCKQTVEKKLGIQVTDFAAPFGHTNAAAIDGIKQVYRSERNTNGDITTNQADDKDINTKENLNRYDIIAVTIRRETTEAELNAAIDYTVKHNGWLVLTYHDIGDGDSAFGIDGKILDMQLATISHAPARIMPVGTVLNALDNSGNGRN